jgi:type III secretion protein C
MKKMSNTEVCWPAAFIRHRSFRLATAVFACLVIGGIAEAGDDVDWSAEAYPYVIVDQDLKKALQEFGRNLGVDVVLSGEVKGRVRQYKNEESAGAFLTGLASAHRLDWFFDGRRLHVSSRAEAVDRSWSVRSNAAEELQAALAEAGLDDPRYPFNFQDGSGTVSLSGPPRYVAMAGQIVDRFRPRPVAAPAVNVIYGRTVDGGAS